MFSLGHIVKNKWINIRPQQCISEGVRKWGIWGTIFLFYANFVPISGSARKTINNRYTHIQGLLHGTQGQLNEEVYGISRLMA